jgi:peptidoglycan/LPS O-acetylase OafA/YrhL
MSCKWTLLISYLLVVATWPFLPIESAQAGTIQLPLPLFHLPQFLLGIALGRLFLLYQPIVGNLYKWFLWGGSLTILTLFAFRSSLSDWPFTAPVLVIPFSLVILGGTCRGEKQNLLAHPFLALLGEASFAIYILQWPLSFWWNWISKQLLHLNLPMAIDFAVYFSFVCVFSVASFMYIESPLRRAILGHSAHKAS